jgi:hypothetical protein
MGAPFNAADLRGLRTLWEKTGGRAWEPPAPGYPWIVRMIEAGFVRRVDMRCGFEAMKDAGLAFTDAGRRVLAIEPELRDALRMTTEALAGDCTDKKAVATALAVGNAALAKAEAGQ